MGGGLVKRAILLHDVHCLCSRLPALARVAAAVRLNSPHGVDEVAIDVARNGAGDDHVPIFAALVFGCRSNVLPCAAVPSVDDTIRQSPLRVRSSSDLKSGLYSMDPMDPMDCNSTFKAPSMLITY